MAVEQKHKQIFWAFGVLERLANLGYICNPPFHIAPEKIDFFLELDSYCKILFNDEEEFSSIMRLVCKDAGVETEEQVSQITDLARDYKDNRDRLVKFALANNLGQDVN